MATYVLVHGGWHGGWCWKKVTPLLRAHGHAVYTPTLTGLGERAHLLSDAVDQETHIADVVNVLAYEDLRDVILVGHSYAGMVITGVADRVPDRIGHLVYFDAFVLGQGETIRGVLGGVVTGDPTPSPPPPIATFQVTDPADVAWAEPRLTAHPGLPSQQPLVLRDPGIVERVPRTYIECLGFTDPLNHLHASYARARTEAGWRHVALDAGHDAMITHPRQLADILLAVPQQTVTSSTA